MSVEKKVGIFITPQSNVVFEQNQWNEVTNFLAESHNVQVEDLVVCGDKKSCAFLIPYEQMASVTSVNEVTVENKKYEVWVGKVRSSDLKSYFPLQDDEIYFSDEFDEPIESEVLSGEKPKPQKTVQVFSEQLSNLKSRRIRSYFESLHNGGGEIEKIDELDGKTILITFADPQVAESIVQKQNVRVNNITLELSWPIDQTNDYEVMVSNVPSDMDEDELIDVLHAKILDDIVSVREVDACRRIVKFSSVDAALHFKAMGSIASGNDVVLQIESGVMSDLQRNLIKEMQGKQEKNQKYRESVNCDHNYQTPPISEDQTKKQKEEQHLQITEAEQAILSPQSESNNEQKRSILVSGLTGKMNLSYLELLFEDEEESQGGELDEAWPIVIDEQNKRANITFKSAEVARRVVKQLKIIDKEDNVTLTLDWAPKRNIVEINGVPANDSPDDIKNLLEQREFGDPNIVKVIPGKSKGQMFVTLESEEDARSLAELKLIQKDDLKLTVTLCNFSPLDVENITPISNIAPENQTKHDQSTERIGNIVLVSGIPKNIAKQKLQLYFKNKSKSGGGPFQENVEFDDNDSQALLCYQDVDTATRVVHKDNGIHLIDGVKLTAQWPEPFVTVEIQNTKSDMTAVNLRNLLTSRTCKQAKVKEMHFVNNKHFAVMESEDEVKKLTTIGKVTYRDVELKFALAKFFKIPAPKITGQVKEQANEEHQGAQKSTEPKIYMLQINNFPENYTEDIVNFFLKKNLQPGKGEILTIDYNAQEHCAYATYKAVEDANGIFKTPLVIGETHQLEIESQLTVLDGKGKPARSHAVKLTGLCRENLNEEITMVLENRKLSGGEPDAVEQIIFGSDPKSATVIFKTAEIAERVAHKKSAKIDGKPVSMTLLKSLPLSQDEGDTEPKKILVHSFSDDCPSDKLKEFLEQGISHNKILSIEFSLVPSVALVTFHNIPNYQALQLLCLQKACYDTMIGIRKVIRPVAIQVHGVRGIDEYALKMHFNSSLGNNCNVKVISCEDDDNCCLIQFENNEAVQKVSAKRKQNYGEKNNIRELTVRPHYSELGIIPPDHDTKEPIRTIPRDLTVEISKPDVIEFAAKAEHMRSEINDKLKSAHATVDWNISVNSGSKFVVLCELKYTTPDIRQQTKKWSHNVEIIVKDFFENFESKTLDVLNAYWNAFSSESSAIINQIKNSSDVLIDLDENLYRVKLVGLKKEVDHLFQEMQNILISLRNKNETKIISEELTKLKPCHLELLQRFKIQETLLNMYNVDVKIDMENKKLLITGTIPDNIGNAKVKILESCQTVTRSVDIQQQFVMLLEQDKTSVKELRESLIEKDMGNLPLDVVWELGENCIVLHGKEDYAVVKGQAIVQDNLLPRTLRLDEPMKKIILLENWLNLKHNEKKQITLREDILKPLVIKYANKNQFDSIAVIGLNAIVLLDLTNVEEKSEITFYGIKTVAEAAKEFIKEYLMEKGIYESFKSFSLLTCKYLELRYKTEFNELQTKHEHENVRIEVCSDSEKPGVAIRGKKNILEIVMMKLIECCDKICLTKHSENDPNRLKFYKAEAGLHFLNTLEKKYKVIISSDKKLITECNKERQQLNDKICSVRLGKQGTKGLEIVALSDSIASLKVDAVINSANSKLELIGGVAGAIQRLGGPEIQAECAAHIQQNGPLAVGDVFVSKAGNLQCKYVFHAVGPHWKGGDQNEENEVYDAVYNVMAKAAELQLKHIALPPIGAGIFGVPIGTSLQNIIDAIKVYFDDVGPSSVETVFLTSNRTDEVREIIKALQKYFGKPQVTLLKNELDERLAAVGTCIKNDAETTQPSAKEDAEKFKSDGQNNDTDNKNDDLFIILAENADIAEEVIKEIQKKIIT